MTFPNSMVDRITPATLPADLRDSKAFTYLYLRFVREIRDNGAMKTLETIV